MKFIIDHLNNCRKTLITSHINPDGDAVSSISAMALWLGREGKSTYLYNESPIPAVYRFLPEAGEIRRFVPAGLEFDTLLVLDCGDIRRIGGIHERFSQKTDHSPTIVNLDHHATNTGFGDLVYIDKKACATTEIIYNMLKTADMKPDQAMATCIYTGIFTDTGSFRFHNTNRAAFEICNEMIDYGVDPYNVAKHVYGTYSLGRIKLLNLALESIEISENGRLSMMTVTKDMLVETGTQPEDTDGLIQYARRIKNVRVAVLIQELTNGNQGNGNQPSYNVSLRSDGGVDVSRIAAAYGGGGHPTAAGFIAKGAILDIKNGIMDLAGQI